MKSKQNKYGLTLVEILVAIAIVAVLAAGLYSVSNYLEKQSKIELTKSTIEILCAALEQYHDFNDGFPFAADVTYGDPNLLLDLNGTAVSLGHKPEYASSEALYYFLNRVPDSKKIIGSINISMLTDKDDNGAKMYITINGQNCPLVRVIDPWKKALRYTYYYNKTTKQGDNFPVITSAGPDRDFNSPADNISSRQ
jgi:prepilin-type N-terminal cleavage/methylation domain-containing protein